MSPVVVLIFVYVSACAGFSLLLQIRKKVVVNYLIFVPFCVHTCCLFEINKFLNSVPEFTYMYGLQEMYRFTLKLLTQTSRNLFYIGKRAVLIFLLDSTSCADTHKIICRGTERATTDLNRLWMKSSRRGASISGVQKIFSFFGELFLKSRQAMP